jgi:hypothetical protein
MRAGVTFEYSIPIAAQVALKIEVAPRTVYLPAEGQESRRTIIAWSPQGLELANMTKADLPAWCRLEDSTQIANGRWRFTLSADGAMGPAEPVECSLWFEAHAAPVTFKLVRLPSSSVAQSSGAIKP